MSIRNKYVAHDPEGNHRSRKSLSFLNANETMKPNRRALKRIDGPKISPLQIPIGNLSHQLPHSCRSNENKMSDGGPAAAGYCPRIDRNGSVEVILEVERTAVRRSLYRMVRFFGLHVE